MRKTQTTRSGRTAAAQLGEFFWRNGYVRRQDADRVENEGWAKYKKGEEVRLVADTQAELKVIRRLLKEAGFEPGKPFVKGRQYRQPLYGRDSVRRFLQLIGARNGP